MKITDHTIHPLADEIAARTALIASVHGYEAGWVHALAMPRGPQRDAAIAGVVGKPVQSIVAAARKTERDLVARMNQRVTAQRKRDEKASSERRLRPQPAPTSVPNLGTSNRKRRTSKTPEVDMRKLEPKRIAPEDAPAWTRSGIVSSGSDVARTARDLIAALGSR